MELHKSVIEKLVLKSAIPKLASYRDFIEYPAAAMVGRVKRAELHKSAIVKLALRSAIPNWES